MSRPDVVFLGPSLDRPTARRLLPDAIFLPPAQMGDVVSAVRRYRPRAVGLIDGVFLNAMSVFHKELLLAVDAGCWVLGAASMGALRAAECDRYGVIGVGGIYERYRSGELEDDDEVALIHGDETVGFRPLSDPLVTIRAALDHAVAGGLLTREERAELLALQGRRWFPDRRLADVEHDAAAIGMETHRVQQLGTFIRATPCDPKRDDAISLLERIRSLPAHPVPIGDRPGVQMSPAFAAMLARDCTVHTDTGDAVTFDEIRRFAALHDRSYADLLSATKRKLALEALSRWLGGELSADELSAGRRRVARQLGVDAVALERAAAMLDVSRAGLESLVEREAHLERMETSSLGSRRLGQITGPFIDELRLTGSYRSLKDMAGLEQRAAKEVALEQTDRLGPHLARFAEMTGWSVPSDLAAYAQQLELGSVAELLDSILTSLRASSALFGSGPHHPSVFDVTIEEEEPLLPRGE